MSLKIKAAWNKTCFPEGFCLEVIFLKLRLLLILIILFLDFFLLPRFFQIPIYIKQTPSITEAFNLWKASVVKDPFWSIQLLVQEQKIRSSWLWLQLSVLVVVITIWFYGRKKSFWGKGELKQAGSGQHGTARWRTDEEIKRTTTIIKYPN